ncbi:Ig-like domain-containing protein [Treponema sp. Marseille-Q4130]|uniref:Ig-like domain-containing protein n=1 Tax=Treponema sp. Marseille-Q4130 TaxID=2766702 RepID=UPI0016524FE2|nr:Ig-like domain-containing protein [Treponema sp. Marseille-Q4130]MBC6719865.1 hypothetical protein [Treponema sp. Marseille-Q4130]
MSFLKTKKTISKDYGLLTAAFIAMAIYMLTVLSCEVSLGGSVDAAPPSNTITYPPKNAVVRSTFVIAGTCSDDTSVASVTLSITNTGTQTSYGPFQADLADDKKSWSIRLNKEKRNVPNHPYAGWDFPDGKYSVTAYATDASGRNSDTTANAFTIDNTPPVLILTSPSSSGTLEPDKSGRTISFTGTYAEDTDNQIAEMKVLLFKKADASKIGEITFNNIDHMAENNKYVIAQYFSTSPSNPDDQRLFDNYKAIFGETNVNNYTNNIGTTVDLPVYMTLLLSDGARVYDDPSNPAGSGPGNRTTHYYRNTDGIIDNFTKENAAYPMSILEIKDFLNGTSIKYTDDTAVTTIITALNGAKSAEYNAADTTLAAADRPNATTLSVNPKANPTFIVSGYAKDTSGITSSSYDSHGFYYYTNGAPFSIVISSGADNVPVKYTDNNVTIYAVPAQTNGEFTNPLPTDWSSTLPNPVPSGWVEVERIENQGNKTSHTINKALSGLVPNLRYRFAVWGKDVNGMQIEQDKNGPYVFVVQSSGNKPVISIGAQDISGGKNTNLEEGSIASGAILASSYTPANKLIFKGTATPAGSPIASVTAAVESIENVDTSATVPSNSLSVSVPSVATLPNWETVVTEATSLPDGNYKVKFKFTVEDNAYAESSVTRSIYIDKKAPVITVENIHNGDLITEENSYIQTIKDSGGNITGRRYSFRGKWSDVKGKGTKTLEYSTDGGAHWHIVTDSVNGSAVPQVTSEASWTANIDVTETENYSIKFRATDAAGLQTEFSNYTGIKFDFSVPTITPLEAKVNTTPTDTDVAGKYVNKSMQGKTLTVEASVSDNLSLGISNAAVEANITATVQHNGTPYTGSDLTVTKEPSSDKKSAVVKFRLTIPSDNTKDGSWTFTVSAKDAAGRDVVTEQSVGVTVDTTEPAWKTDNTPNKVPYISPENTGGWYNRTALLIKALAEDGGSDVDKLQYKLSTESNWNDVGNGNFTFTVSDTFNGNIIARATDKAGNYIESIHTVKIDTAAPDTCTLGTVDGQSGVTTKLVNNDTAQVEFTFTASDASGGSGLNPAEIKVIKIGNTVLSPAIVPTESGGTYTAIIPQASLADGAVTVRLTDNAGNTADFALFTLQKDIAPPTVRINTPASEVTVNKTITVSGTASDNREIANKVEVFIKTGSGTNDWEVYKTTPVDTLITDGVWTFDLDTNNITAPSAGGIDTYDSDGNTANGRQLTFKITAKDAAGNVKSEERTVTVDQNADRPVIRFTNLSLTGMTSSTPVWFKGSDTIYGGITDDDGEVKSDGAEQRFKYSTDGGVNWTYIPVSGGSWNLTLPDGPKTILFKVTDPAGNEFTSSDADSTMRPKLNDGTTTFSEDTKLYLKVDTHAPEMQNIQISSDGTNWSDDFKTVGGNPLMLGGTTDKFFIRFEAKDANDIDENNLFVKVSNLWLDSGTEIAAHKYTTASAGANETHVNVTSVPMADRWKQYTFSNISCKPGSGTMKLEIVATDTAGNTSPIMREVKVDNTAPKVDFSSPTTETGSGISPTKGDTRVSGEIDDSTAQVWFAVSPSGTVSPESDTASNNSYTYVDAGGNEHTASISSFDPSKTVYKPVEDVSARWYIMFDADTDAAATGTHSLTLNKWLVKLKITTDADITSTAYDKITKLYVWIKATDAHGNTKEYKFPIWHDPQGDRPSVTIDYPANNAKLGGTVRLAGNATDNNEPKAVFVQILRDENNIPTGAPTPADLNYWQSKGYGVYLMSGSGSSGTAWTGTPASGKTAADYGILATLTGGSWSLPINGNGELNPSGNTPNNVKITAYAYDASHNKSLPKSVNVTFDKNNPVFGSIQLVKSANENLSTPNSAQQTTASGGTYSVKDTWYIYGSVTDADSIKRLTIKDGSTTHALITGGTATSSSGSWNVTNTGNTATFKYKLDTAIGVGECPIEIEAYDATSQEYSSKYTLTIRYDNEPPVLLASSETGYNIDVNVSQSDSFYTFGSKVKENPVGGIAQSGFKRLAFYFMRHIGGNFVYDPMLVKTDPKNKLTIGGNISYDSGLYWKEYSGVSWNSSNPAALTFSTDANVHAGGLVQANGAIYRIQSVTGSGITLDTALAANPGVTVKVALALVVDHLSSEGGVTSASLEADGYYSAANLFNDDGDRMIESVSKTGSVWTWEASICSRNIPDGPIELHYVAFDEAGNYQTGVVSNAKVSNNRPRIAGVTFGTDYNGNGAIEESEKVKAYRAPKTKAEYDADNGDHVPGITSLTGFIGADKAIYDPSGKQYKYPGRKAVQLTTDLTLDVKADMTVRGYTEITPEIVGGNGAIYYQYDLPGIGAGVNTTAFIASGTDNYTIAEGTIKLQFGDILKLSDNTAQSEKTLSFRFWDSTEGAALITTPGTGWQAGRQSADLKVKMTLARKTPTEPKTTIAPFYWNKENDNSLYDNSRENGHLEVENGLPAAFSGSTGVMDRDPKVSGQIVMRGTAHDDSFIEGLYIRVPGMESVFTSAGLTVTQTVDSVTYYRIADGSSGHLTGTNRWSTHGFKFEAYDETIGKGGHDAKWTFSWDTSKIINAAKADVEVHVLAYNKGTPTCAESTSHNATYKHASVDGKNYYADAAYATPIGSAPSTVQTTAGTPTNRYRMDVVPFITEIKTGLTSADGGFKGAFSRASTGEYPVQEGERIQIFGFNIGTNAAKVSIPGMTPDTQLAASGSLANTILLTGATSGDIVLKVNNITAINNMIDERKAYNIEANNMNNNKLTVKRKLFVWKNVELIDNAALESPQFVMDKNSKYYLTYGNLKSFGSGSDAMRLSTKINGAENNDWEKCYSKYHNTVIAYDESGNPYLGATNTDRSGQSTAFTLFFQEAQIGAYAYSTNSKKRRLENSDNAIRGVYDVNRVQIPKMAVRGSGTLTDPARLALVYFDKNVANDAPVKFRYGTVKSPTNISGGLQYNIQPSGGDGDPDSSGSAKGYEVVANTASGHQGGGYAAVGLTSTNRAVVVWYDAANSQLVYSYRDMGTSYTAPGIGADRKTTDWQNHAVVIDDGAPLYVDLVIDDEDGLHIGYYSSGNGGVRYAYLAPDKVTGTAKPDTSDFKIATVDTYMNPGTFLKMGVRKENNKQVPYISYYHNGFYGSKNAARIAWLKDGIASTDDVKNGVSNNKFTGDWVVMTVPARSGIQQYTICQGVPTNGIYANKVIAAYFTNKNYEMAVLTKN